MVSFCDEVVATIHQNTATKEGSKKKTQNGQQEDVPWKQHLKPVHCGGVPPSHSTSSADPFPLQNWNEEKKSFKVLTDRLVHGFRVFYG